MKSTTNQTLILVKDFLKKVMRLNKIIRLKYLLRIIRHEA